MNAADEAQLDRIADRLYDYYRQHPEYYTSGKPTPPSPIAVAVGETESAASRIRSHRQALKMWREREATDAT